MGWYTHIYVCVRNVKKKNSFLGHILSSFLNIILVFQLIFIGFSIHVYDEHIAGHFLQNSLQSTFYLLIYLTLTFMTIICLFVTILTPVARVPENYRVDDEKDKQLKLLTTQFDGKYVRSSTSKQNISKYTEILDEIANEKNIRMLERSRLGGYKYCYECQHLKPDRTKHCRSCGHCVLRYDHHCPYINKCINYNNYKSFCLYLFYSVLAVCWFFLSSCECVLRFVINANWEKDANSIIWIISFLIPISIFGFTIFTDIFLYHYDLICRNCTTAEEAGTYHMRYDKSASYDLGRKRNIQNIFGWGLWLFPFWTTLEDGLHYEIKTSPSSKFLIKRIICEE